MELDTIGDAEAITNTCRVMRDAFKHHEEKITWAILCRDLGTTFLCTIGAMAVLVSPRKGRVDEPLSTWLGICPLYWSPMLMDHGERARELITLRIADQMMCVYRQFPRRIGRKRRPGGCSACARAGIVLPVEARDPGREEPEGQCLEYLLHANAVHYRLRCRMVLGYKAPTETHH